MEILDDINEEYNLNLGYGSVDNSTVSLSEYEQFIRSVAEQQKELKDMIANRTPYAGNEVNGLIGAKSSKTITKDAWTYGDMFSITATYDVNGISISNPRNLTVNQKKPFFTYTVNNGSPTTSIIDSGRTLTVKYYGTIKAPEGITVTNAEVYAEFYYDS